MWFCYDRYLIERDIEMASFSAQDGQNPLPAAPVGSVDARDGDEAGALTLVPGRRQKLGEQLYGQILEQIVSGRLQAGDRLPPEQEISRMFGVSRPIVRQALIRLREDGLLQARQGAGTFVRPRPAPSGETRHHAADATAYLRGMEVRLPLEAAAARLAAERHQAPHLASIDRAQELLHVACERREGITQADADFHLAVAEASGNPLFVILLRPPLDLIEPFLDLSECDSDVHRVVLAEHDSIRTAIQAHDAQAAEAAMESHLCQSRLRLLARITAG
jgi:GntR family transcriptional repressor for pyruvate dehydrogenase complex